MRLRIFTEPQFGASYDAQLTAAKAAEDLGFDAYFRSDHYLTMRPGDGLPGPTDSWITLAGLARETSRIRLGTLVSAATFRLPGVLAIQVAQVDAMSGGRVELGLGTGWYEAEHAAYGIPFPERRFGLFEEQLEIITGLWETEAGKTYSFAGEHYRVTDSPALPKPVQRPRPPIIVGGGGLARTPRLAARYADEFNANFQSAPEAAKRFGLVRAALAAVDRPASTMTFSAALPLCCGRDDAEIARRTAVLGGSLAGLRDVALAGTPSEVVDKIGAYAEAGASTMYLQVLDLADLDHLELVASQVAPQVASL